MSRELFGPSPHRPRLGETTWCCRECGSFVPSGSKGTHRVWHETVASAVRAMSGQFPRKWECIAVLGVGMEECFAGEANPHPGCGYRATGGYVPSGPLGPIDDFSRPGETLESYVRPKRPREVEFPDHRTGWEIHEPDAPNSVRAAAMNIVNGLFEMAEMSVEWRQAHNDEADEFVQRVLTAQGLS